MGAQVQMAKVFLNGHPLRQVPWMIIFYFRPNFLPLLSPWHNNFGISKPSLARSSPMQTCRTSSPLRTRLRALECGRLLGKWSESTEAWTAAIGHKLSWGKHFATKRRDSNVEYNFDVGTVAPRKQERRKKSIWMKMVL